MNDVVQQNVRQYFVNNVNCSGTLEERVPQSSMDCRVIRVTLLMERRCDSKRYRVKQR